MGSVRRIFKARVIPPRLSPRLIGWIPPGANAFKRDVPDADIRFLDAGHFALETNVDDVASAILKMAVNKN